MANYDYDLRKLQLVQVGILKDFKAICEKHNIKYYLSSGTLLGAVRHKGFIPWDNDIDVCMPCEDYIRFLNLPKEEIGSKYFLQSYESDRKYYRNFTKMRLNNTTMMYPWERNYHIHHGVWIDVFPMIEVNSESGLKFKKFLIKVANTLRMQDYFEEMKDAWRAVKSERTIKVLELFYKLTPKKPRERIHHRIIKRIYGAKNKKNISLLWCTLTKRIPKSYFCGKPEKLDFEGEMYSVPPKYHECLTLLYGDYMQLPPEEERVCHEQLIIDFNNDYTIYMENNI